jgi:serine/threonine protein kinase
LCWSLTTSSRSFVCCPRWNILRSGCVYFPLAGLPGMFTCVRACIQIIRVLGHYFDAAHSLLRFWMPFMPFTLADLLAVPTFSPIPDPDAAAHDAQSILAFSTVAKSIVYQVLSGVAHLHSQDRRIAHRDIKPRNILLDTLGVAVLIDFGVAYSPTAGPRDVWPEPEGKMYFEVGSGYVWCLPASVCVWGGCWVPDATCLIQTLSRPRTSVWCAQIRCDRLRLVVPRGYFCGILHDASPPRYGW